MQIIPKQSVRDITIDTFDGIISVQVLYVVISGSS